ncbi:PAS domain-containing protein, partial [Methylobacterium marchantiae]
MNFFRSNDLTSKIEALDRSQAIIEFGTDGTILTANRNFLDAVGYDLAEIQGKHHSLFVDPAFRESQEYRAFWTALAAGTFQSGEFKRIGKGAREIWLQATYNPILGRDGRPTKIVKFASDITERVMRSINHEGQIKALDRSQAVIEFALDGTILTANKNFLDVMGYSLAEIQGRHHGMFVDPDLRAGAEYKRFWENLGRGEYQADEY